MSASASPETWGDRRGMQMLIDLPPGKEPLTDAERSELADHLSRMRIPAAAR